MVTVAQLAEHWIVVPRVVGSNPISHPKRRSSEMNSFFFCWELREFREVRELRELREVREVRDFNVFIGVIRVIGVITIL